MPVRSLLRIAITVAVTVIFFGLAAVWGACVGDLTLLEGQDMFGVLSGFVRETAASAGSSKADVISGAYHQLAEGCCFGAQASVVAVLVVEFFRFALKDSYRVLRVRK